MSRRMIPVTPMLLRLMKDRMVELGIQGARELAYRTGEQVSRGSTHRILSQHQSRVRAHTIVLLADALDLSVDVLLAAADETNPPWVLPRAFDAVDPAVRPDVERAMHKLLEVGGLIPTANSADPQPAQKQRKKNT